MVLPLIYGIGTAVPVLLVAFLLAYSAKSVGKTYNVLAEDRVVGAADHRLAIRVGWRLVFAQVRFRGHLNMP